MEMDLEKMLDFIRNADSADVHVDVHLSNLVVNRGPYARAIGGLSLPGSALAR